MLYPQPTDGAAYRKVLLVGIAVAVGLFWHGPWTFLLDWRYLSEPTTFMGVLEAASGAPRGLSPIAAAAAAWIQGESQPSDTSLGLLSQLGLVWCCILTISYVVQPTVSRFMKAVVAFSLAGFVFFPTFWRDASVQAIPVVLSLSAVLRSPGRAEGTSPPRALGLLAISLCVAALVTYLDWPLGLITAVAILAKQIAATTTWAGPLLWVCAPLVLWLRTGPIADQASTEWIDLTRALRTHPTCLFQVTVASGSPKAPQQPRTSTGRDLVMWDYGEDFPMNIAINTAAYRGVEAPKGVAPYRTYADCIFTLYGPSTVPSSPPGHALTTGRKNPPGLYIIQTR